MKITIRRPRTSLRPLAAVALAALVAPVLTACNTSDASGSGGMTFALITINGKQSFFVQQAQGAKNEAKKLGVKVTTADVGTSAEKTITDVQNAIAQDVDGIIIAPASGELGPRIMTLADRAKVPVLAIDNNFNDADGKPVPLVGIDAPAVGKDSGTMLAGQYQKSGWSDSDTYYLSVELPNFPTCTLRTDAAKKAFLSANPSFPSDHVVVVPYDGTVEKALSATRPVQVAHSDAKHWLITSCNDDGTVGAGKALIAAHVSPADVLGVGLGGDLACQAWGKGAAPTGMVETNYFDAGEFGEKAVKVMYEYIKNGTKMPELTVVSTVHIDPQNYADSVKC